MLLTIPYTALDRQAVPETVSEARRLISAFAAENGADRRLVGDIALAVTEALANVVMHAYPPGRAGLVSIAADVEDDDLEVVVTDDGLGFQPGPSPGMGVGLSIVAETAHEFVVREREPHGIELWMRFHLTRVGPETD